MRALELNLSLRHLRRSLEAMDGLPGVSSDLLGRWNDACCSSGSRNTCEPLVQELLQCGSDAEPVFCDALEDYWPDVRILAAQGLGEIGSAGAVPALKEALRREMTGRTGAGHFWLGLLYLTGRLLLGVILLPICIGLALIFTIEIVGGLGIWYSELVGFVQQRRKAAQVISAMAVALARIAERSPDPGLRELLPDLEMVQRDPQHSALSREQCRLAMHRIDVLTRHLRELPTPAATRPSEPGSLPRPSYGSAPKSNRS